MVSAAKLATAHEQALDHSSVKSSIADRKGWAESRQITSCTCDAHAVRKQTIGMDCALILGSKILTLCQLQFLQVCKLLASYVTRGPHTTHEI